MNQITQIDKKSTDIASLYPELSQKQIRAARLLASNVSIGTIAPSLGVADSVVAGWLDDEDFSDAVAFLAMRGNIISQLMQEATILSWMHIVDVLARDYSSLPASAKNEILKTARMVIQASGDAPQSVNNNVGSVQMFVSGGSVDAIARRVTELQSVAATADKGEISSEYSIVDVDAQYSTHPDTDIGTINYDEESDKYQCHVCGTWQSDLYSHTRHAHGLTKERYGEIYGIK